MLRQRMEIQKLIFCFHLPSFDSTRSVKICDNEDNSTGGRNARHFEFYGQVNSGKLKIMFLTPFDLDLVPLFQHPLLQPRCLKLRTLC